MPFEAATYIIIAIYQLSETILCENLAVDRIHLESNDKVSSKHLYLNNAPKATIYIIITIYQLFETIS